MMTRSEARQAYYELRASARRLRARVRGEVLNVKRYAALIGWRRRIGAPTRPGIHVSPSPDAHSSVTAEPPSGASRQPSRRSSRDA
jgi:hypothetical protein